MNNSDLIGMTLDEARKLAEQSGYTIRPTCIDGEQMFGTCDMKFNRINVVVENNVITSVGRNG